MRTPLWVLKRALNNLAGTELPDLLMDLTEVKLQFTLLSLLRVLTLTKLTSLYHPQGYVIP